MLEDPSEVHLGTVQDSVHILSIPALLLEPEIADFHNAITKEALPV